ncbi:MAG: exo-alpha-sialidase [Candidatus Eisenbacteria bacterium]
MRSSLRCFRAAVAPLLVLGATFSAYGVANACGENHLDGRKFTPDGFMVTDAPEMSESTDDAGASASCPAPPCSHSTCATINPSTPFQRLPGYEALPISRWAGCFGIAKRDASFYVQLTLDGPGNGFHRNVSTDGGFTWTAGSVVIAPNTNWWSGIKCPDLQYLPNGDLLLYFRAAGASGNPTGIARGLSTDDGVTWTFNSGPVLTSPVVGFAVDNPSVLRRSANSYMMAYTLVCAGPGVTGPFQLAETYLAVSSDGINWTHSVNNPALTPGACGAWDQGGVCNPQLEADPISSSKLHPFYTGADWNGYTTRGCTKIGHAISTNNGRTWCKTGVVLDHPPSTSVAGRRSTWPATSRSSPTT